MFSPITFNILKCVYLGGMFSLMEKVMVLKMKYCKIFWLQIKVPLETTKDPKMMGEQVVSTQAEVFQVCGGISFVL